MNNEEQAPGANVEIVPAPEPKDDSAIAENNGRNGNPAQSAGRVTAREQDAHPGTAIEFEGKEAKHLP